MADGLRRPNFVARSGAAADLYRLCERGLRRLPGRLAVATIVGNTVFAAVTGVSIAAAAAFSRIAYPEMMKLGYRQTYALGAVAGSACLGMLIPPSILLIVWAILTEMSVGALFIAGVLPGLILALLFAAYAVIAAARNPAIAPRREINLEPMTPAEIRSEAIGGFGVLFLVLLVIGGIWRGFFTPTEAVGLAFAIFGILVIEAGLLTPPFGLLVYTVNGSVPDRSVTLGKLFAGSTPYFLMILLAALLVLLFPGLASWLPRQMF